MASSFESALLPGFIDFIYGFSEKRWKIWCEVQYYTVKASMIIVEFVVLFQAYSRTYCFFLGEILQWSFFFFWLVVLNKSSPVDKSKSIRVVPRHPSSCGIWESGDGICHLPTFSLRERKGFKTLKFPRVYLK